jgi:hypothetical protein
MLKKLINYLYSLTVSSTKESSKRFMSLFTLLPLVSYVVLMHTTDANAHIMLSQLLLFVAALAGVATYESVKKNKNKDE